MSADTTTLRLEDTAHDSPGSAWWVLWSGLGASSVTRLGAERLVLGRGSDGDGRLEYPGVSRKHAELLRRGPLFVARDLGSTNGTFVNGQRIEQLALSDGDVLRLGDAVGVVLRTKARAEPPRTREPIPGVLFGPGMADVLDLVTQVAETSLPVVIEGPTGTGKEMVARAVHALSGRSGPLQAVNCGALPAALAEAELFGHRKGAFTGAELSGLGHVRAAHGGTLFLDELCDLAPAVQVKLLRVLQERQVTPLGETRPQPVDLRVVVATLIPLPQLVAQGRLREDFAARLAGVSISLPPLRQRRADIPSLLDYLLRRHSGGRPPSLDGKLLEQLLLADWPGNVRELELLTRRLLVLGQSQPVLRRGMLPQGFEVQPAVDATAVAVPNRRPPEAREADLARLRERYAEHGNLTRAASEAGISRQRAYRLLTGPSSRQLLVDDPGGSAAHDDGEATD
jgi:DNA-binding NtrC family response regulator